MTESQDNDRPAFLEGSPQVHINDVVPDTWNRKRLLYSISRNRVSYDDPIGDPYTKMVDRWSLRSWRPTVRADGVQS